MQTVRKWRALVVGGFIVLLLATLIFRLYIIQVLDSNELVALAKNTWETNKKIVAVRGSILDRHNEPLAFDAPSYTVAVDPKLIFENNQVDQVINTLGPILNMNEEKLRGLVTKKRSNGNYYRQVELRNEGWQIDALVADKIRDAIKGKELYGIYLLNGSKRFYPYQDMASHVLGYLHKEGGPVGGVESKYNRLLEGVQGFVQYEKDLKGVELPNGSVKIQPAKNGNNIRLTIDRNIQQFMEQALDKAEEQYKPKSMMAIAVDPMTMEILAISNRPNFNPNQYWQYDDQKVFYNHSIGSVYEPGSTFKIVALTGAVEEGMFDPNETYMSGSIRVPGATIRDHNRTGWGKITYLEGLQRSSNVEFVKLGYERLGAEKFMEYINKFGFNEKTNLDLPGEAKGHVKYKYPSEIATATFGQGGVSVTPLQQVIAFASIANGGKIMKPYMVKDVIEPETGNVLQSFGPQVVRQAFSAETASKVTEYLEAVVADQKKGTGKYAAINGYRVAGKTGTAQKVVDGIYASDKWVLSFIGFAPADNPRILCAVIIDEPDTGGSYVGGGTVTAPIFQDIVSKSLAYLGVQASGGKVVEVKPVKTYKVPSLKGKKLSQAMLTMSKTALNPIVLGNGASVLNQFPKAQASVTAGQSVYLITSPVTELELPELTGQSLRDVFEICSIFKAQCRTNGEGYVQSQERVDKGSVKEYLFEMASLSEVFDLPPTPTPTHGPGEASDLEEGPALNPDGSSSLTPVSSENPEPSNGNAVPAQTPDPTPQPTPEPTPQPTIQLRQTEKRYLE